MKKLILLPMIIFALVSTGCTTTSLNSLVEPTIKVATAIFEEHPISIKIGNEIDCNATACVVELKDRNTTVDLEEFYNELKNFTVVDKEKKSLLKSIYEKDPLVVSTLLDSFAKYNRPPPEPVLSKEEIKKLTVKERHDFLVGYLVHILEFYKNEP